MTRRRAVATAGVRRWARSGRAGIPSASPAIVLVHPASRQSFSSGSEIAAWIAMLALDLGGAVCRNWRRSGARMRTCREGAAAALARITGTARGEKLRQQAPDGLEDSSPRNFRSRRRRPRRPRTRSCAQRPWPPRLPRARSTRGTGPCGGAEMPLAASGRLALPYGPH